MKRSKPTNNRFFYFLFLSILGTWNSAFSQELQEDPPIIIEEHLENLAESQEELETEDDHLIQDLHYFLKHPLNLNTAQPNQLRDLYLLNDLQIENLVTYRKLMGNLLNIYELQAIPGWDVETINRIRPFITLEENKILPGSFRKQFKKGNYTFLFRASQVLEKSKGYLLDPNATLNYYPGSRQKMLLRFKFKSNNIQYGFTADKDAGEQFFKGAQKTGFDFYSAHLFIKNVGMIKSVALGDFSINMGQGLIQWQSLAFGKGTDITNTKRQGEVLKPYNSSGEIIFHRGIGLTVQKRKLEATAFASYRKMDGGFVADSLGKIDYITAFRTSGYHRTNGEIAGKGIQQQLTIGGNVSWNSDRFHAGLNTVQYHFEHLVKKSDFWYNKFSFSGNRASNYSLDYSYTYKNIHLFGEAAGDEKFNKALVQGILISADKNVSMSFVYRNISPEYHSFFSSAFTSNSTPSNEKGFYSGITIKPTMQFQVNAYADFFYFPWLKYRVDAPSRGNDYMIQGQFQPDKQISFLIRYRFSNKPINFNPDGLIFNPVIDRPKKSVRSEINYQPNSQLSFRSRVEFLSFDQKSAYSEDGFLTFIEFRFKPSSKPFSGNMRICYFETDGYDSRIYAFESDVLYGYSVPVFFDKGYRYYFNARYKFSKNLSMWTRFAQTIYDDRALIGSGLDEIKGNKKSEIKLQAIYNF